MTTLRQTLTRDATYWDSVKAGYPYRVRQQKNPDGPTLPDPTAIPQVFGGFIRVPLTYTIMWGFVDKADADRFLAAYDGEDATEKEPQP